MGGTGEEGSSGGLGGRQADTGNGGPRLVCHLALFCTKPGTVYHVVAGEQKALGFLAFVF